MLQEIIQLLQEMKGGVYGVGLVARCYPSCIAGPVQSPDVVGLTDKYKHKHVPQKVKIQKYVIYDILSDR